MPGGRSQTVYLVLNDFGTLGRSWLETDEDETDLETIISGMLEGQYSNPVDVFAFNAAEEWARDVSEYVADEIRYRGGTGKFVVPARDGRRRDRTFRARRRNFLEQGEESPPARPRRAEV